MSANKLHSPASERNRDVILAVLKEVLPETGTVLEIASGSGQHVAHFARHLPDLTWQPSDMETDHRLSVAEWAAGLTNIRAVIDIDVLRDDWSVWTDIDAIYSANMLHISPWEVAVGLFTGAGHLLPAGAPLVIYGPFIREGVETASSNLAFDQSLKGRNPDWGIRPLSDVRVLAAEHGLVLDRVEDMPANNLVLVFHKTA